MNKKKVIIDCDPGIDDSLAIMLALSSKEIEVVGITIVSGNVINEKGYKNALKVLKLMDRLDVPVYIGEAYPRKRELITAEDTHGEDGLGETNFPEIDMEVKRGAVDFILKMAREEVSIIALGPFMNLAKALQDAWVPYEIHIFQNGEHGLAMADGNNDLNLDIPHIHHWGELCTEWLKEVIWERKIEKGENVCVGQ